MSELICDSCGLKDYGDPGYCGRNLGDGYCCGTLHKPAPKRHRLSIEECVYWLVVVGEGEHALERIARQDAREVRAVARVRLQEARRHRRAFNNAVDVNYADIHAELWRKRTARARLLLEAAKRIREAKR